jgi:hypothetical protein
VVSEPSRSAPFEIGFELPLTREQFRRALHRGHGRARLHVDRYGAREVREDILDAATTCRVYDPQIEGLHADWLAELCLDADIVASILERSSEGESWDRRQRCALLKEFASRGSEAARKALYAECVRDENSSQLLGSDEIVELDGEAGFLFVARTMGTMLAEVPGYWVDDDLLRVFDEKYGVGRAAEILRSRAHDDLAIRRYLGGVTERAVEIAESRTRPSNLSRSWKEVVNAISTSTKTLYWLGHWGRHATREQLEPIVDIVRSASTPRVLENALRCLSHVFDLPLEPRCFDLLLHDDEDVRLFSARVLAKHVDTRIRDAGRAALSRDVRVAVTLFRRNGETKDGPAIAAALRPIGDPDEQHHLGYDVVELIESNREIREPLLALYVYEHSPCINCRSRATKALDASSACPPWLLTEGVRDAAEDVREICSRRGPAV